MIVASSDCTHFGPNYGYQPFKDDVARRLRELADQAAAPIQNCNFDGFVDHLTKTGDTICGRGAHLAALAYLVDAGRRGGRAHGH